jgi:hypothetical protein
MKWAANFIVQVSSFNPFKLYFCTCRDFSHHMNCIFPTQYLCDLYDIYSAISPFFCILAEHRFLSEVQVEAETFNRKY